MGKPKPVSVITVDGVEIQLEKKNIRNMYIRISPPDGLVKLTAPRLMPLYRIEAFARQRMDWIIKHKQEYRIKPESTFCDGEKLALWGENYAVVTIPSRGRAHITQNDTDMALCFFVPQNFGSKEKSAMWDEFCREALRARIPDALERCEKTVGVKAGEWHIKKMKTRWGSCNYIKKRIWLNMALVYKPPVCLDYVITHELVHLYEIKHNDRFKSYMDMYFPNWREVKRLLNEERS